MPPLPVTEGYAEFLQRLKERERYEPPPRGRGPEKLEGMFRLLERLGHPERAFEVVHVAGTNGKGMTAAMVARLLGDAGKKVGLYTSPHLLDIRERIVLEGRPIAETAFADVGTAVLDAAEGLPEHLYLSYFDLLTAMGFLAFRRAGMEWAVVEVGLGGFSDATNTTEKALCILTRLGLDHMSVLGETPRLIAEQKLGILRPGVPVVVAQQGKALRPWLERRIGELGSPAVFVEPLRACLSPADSRAMVVKAPDEAGAQVDLPVIHATAPRLDCAATALVAGDMLLGAGAPFQRGARLRIALETPFPGRLQYCEHFAVAGAPAPPFGVGVFDGGHNAGALEALGAQLRAWDIAGYTLIFGLQKDKMVPAVHEALRDLFSRAACIITLAPQTPRSPTAEEMAAFIARVLAGTGAELELRGARDARGALLEAARFPERPLVVSGSFWMLGDVMAELDIPASEAGAR
jgi:dihydrofolate synthase/folylpolyglutamate synthase